MQPQFRKPIRQDSRHRLKHNALPPESAIKFVARFGMMKAFTKVMEAARTNHSVFTPERNAPADGLSLGIACLYLSDQLMGIVQQSMRLKSIKLHGFLVRKYRKECLRITGLDLPEQQSVRGEARKKCKCSIA